MKSDEQVIEELTEERAELDIKIDKLTGFLKNDPKLGFIQWDLLHRQSNAMTTYSNILSARIRNLRESKRIRHVIDE